MTVLALSYYVLCNLKHVVTWQKRTEMQVENTSWSRPGEIQPHLYAVGITSRVVDGKRAGKTENDVLKQVWPASRCVATSEAEIF